MSGHPPPVIPVAFLLAVAAVTAALALRFFRWSGGTA